MNPLTLTRSQADLIRKQVGSLSAQVPYTNETARADLSRLSDKGYVRIVPEFSDNVPYKVTERGRAALLDYDAEQAPKASASVVKAYFIKEYKWILGGLGTIILFFLGIWLT